MVDDEAIIEAGRTLAAEASAPAAVVLFGSRARGSGRADSDLDFLVSHEFPWTHDIRHLLERLGAIGVAVPDSDEPRHHQTTSTP